METINSVWNNVVACEGQTFRQIRGGEFTYAMKGNTIALSRTRQSIHKSNFEKALALMPFKDTKALQRAVRGPSYVYALPTDERIVGKTDPANRPSRF